MGSSLKGLSSQERELISIFSANEKVTVTVDDIIEFRSCSRETANQILSRLAKKRWLQRIKRGVYSIIPISSITANPIIEEVWPLVVEIFKPAYISGWTAAEHWDLTEQIFNSVSVVTQIPQRTTLQIINGIKIKARVIKKEFFWNK
jgi:predicted transcriptional regulator of viral defense system